jgi:hypothetical protein
VKIPQSTSSIPEECPMCSIERVVALTIDDSYGMNCTLYGSRLTSDSEVNEFARRSYTRKTRGSVFRVV